MKPRQSIDMGTFQLQRSKTSATHSLYKSSQQNTQPHASFNNKSSLNTNPITKKRRKKPFSQPLYTKINPNLPQLERAAELVKLVLANEYHTNHSNFNNEKRLLLEQEINSTAKALQLLIHKTSAEYHNQIRPNPEQQNINQKIAHMEILEASCHHELSLWENVSEQVSKPLSWPKLHQKETQNIDLDLLQVQNLFAEFTDAMNTFTLKTHHILSMGKQLESINRETHFRVHAVAAAMNDNVLSQLGGTSGESIKVPITLKSVAANQPHAH